MKKYALIGERLKHSYSKIVHTLMYEELNIDASFELLECSEDKLLETIGLLKSGVYQGFNVTFPYKVKVMEYLDEISSEARAIGSVNTIALENGKAVGYNTDVYGFYAELVYYNIDVKNKDCYILGTGGAAMAVHKALEWLGGNVLYVSRHPKGDNQISYLELEGRSIDVLVNATPVGLFPKCDECPCKKEIASKAKNVLDVIFNPRITKILEYGHSNMNGLFMLVYQAVKSEEIFQGIKYSGDIEGLLKRTEALI